MELHAIDVEAAKSSTPDARPEAEEEEKPLMDKKVDIGEAGIKGWTALHNAAKAGHMSEVKTLLNNKEDVNAKTVDGLTPLHYAAWYGHFSVAQALLEAGADINGISENTRKQEVTENYYTPLQLAAKHNHRDVVSLLLGKGCNIAAAKEPTPTSLIAEDLLKFYLDGRVSQVHGKSNSDTNSGIELDYDFLIAKHGTSPRIQQQVLDDLIHSTRSKRELLLHPVINSFIMLRWRRVRVMVWLNIIITFMLSLLTSVYIVLPRSTENQNNTVVLYQYEKLPNIVISYPVLKTIISGLLTLVLFRKFFQAMTRPKNFVKNYENYLEMTFFALTYSTLLLECSNPHSDTLTAVCPHLNAVNILLAWVVFLLLLGRLPVFSLQVGLFKKVVLNYCQYLYVSLILVFAFSLSFFTLFSSSEVNTNATSKSIDVDGNKNIDNFETVWTSVFATLVMMTGEFSTENRHFEIYIGTSHVIFLLFVFFVAIALFNLLTALAVSDTNEMLKSVKIVNVAARASLIIMMDDVLISLQNSWVMPLCVYRFVCFYIFSKYEKIESKISISYSSKGIFMTDLLIFYSKSNNEEATSEENSENGKGKLSLKEILPQVQMIIREREEKTRGDLLKCTDCKTTYEINQSIKDSIENLRHETQEQLSVITSVLLDVKSGLLEAKKKL